MATLMFLSGHGIKARTHASVQFPNEEHHQGFPNSDDALSMDHCYFQFFDILIVQYWMTLVQSQAVFIDFEYI